MRVAIATAVFVGLFLFSVEGEHVTDDVMERVVMGQSMQEAPATYESTFEEVSSMQDPDYALADQEQDPDYALADQEPEPADASKPETVETPKRSHGVFVGGKGIFRKMKSKMKKAIASAKTGAKKVASKVRKAASKVRKGASKVAAKVRSYLSSKKKPSVKKLLVPASKFKEPFPCTKKGKPCKTKKSRRALKKKVKARKVYGDSRDQRVTRKGKLILGSNRRRTGAGFGRRRRLPPFKGKFTKKLEKKIEKGHRLIKAGWASGKKIPSKIPRKSGIKKLTKAGMAKDKIANPGGRKSKKAKAAARKAAIKKALAIRKAKLKKALSLKRFLNSKKKSPTPSPTPARKPTFQATFYHGLAGLSNVGQAMGRIKGRRPGKVLHVSKIWYRSTSGHWAGLNNAFKDNYVAKFTGNVGIPRDGKYTFWTNSDDGSRLYVNGKTVVNNDGLHGMRSKSGSRHLKAGQSITVVVLFFERGGGAGLEVSWSGPGFGKRALVASKVKCKIHRSHQVKHMKPTCRTATSRSNNAGVVRPGTSRGYTMVGGGIANKYTKFNSKAGFEESYPDGHKWRCDTGFGPGKLECYNRQCKLGSRHCTTRSVRLRKSGVARAKLPKGYVATGGGLVNHYRKWHKKSAFEESFPDGNNGWRCDMGIGAGDFTCYVRGCKASHGNDTLECTTRNSKRGNYNKVSCPKGYAVTGCGMNEKRRRWDKLSAFEQMRPDGNKGCICDSGFGKGDNQCFARCCRVKTTTKVAKKVCK